MRPPSHNITGALPRLRATRSRLFLGFYDGVACLVQLPNQDMQQDGPVGLATGIGKGIGGLGTEANIWHDWCWGILQEGPSSRVARSIFEIHRRERALEKTYQDRPRRKKTFRITRTGQVQMLLDGIQRNEVEVRTRALGQWISREQQRLEEARER